MMTINEERAQVCKELRIMLAQWETAMQNEQNEIPRTAFLSMKIRGLCDKLDALDRAA